MVELKNINLSFPDIKLFENFNLKIQAGEKICISGDSGKGKSTLLKMLQGYVIPDDGEIYIHDILMDHHNIKTIRNLMTWIPQNVNLPVDNGLELLQLMNIPENEDKVISLMENLGLEPDYLTKNFTLISGGQKQRVIISICLSIDAKIVVMDEPTSSLDNNSIQMLINTINQFENRTFISASHNSLWLEKSGRVVEL